MLLPVFTIRYSDLEIDEPPGLISYCNNYFLFIRLRENVVIIKFRKKVSITILLILKYGLVHFKNNSPFVMCMYYYLTVNTFYSYRVLTKYK